MPDSVEGDNLGSLGAGVGPETVRVLRAIEAELPVCSPEWAEVWSRLAGVEELERDWAAAFVARHGHLLGDRWLEGAVRAAGFVGRPRSIRG